MLREIHSLFISLEEETRFLPVMNSMVFPSVCKNSLFSLRLSEPLQSELKTNRASCLLLASYLILLHLLGLSVAAPLALVVREVAVLAVRHFVQSVD